MPRGTAVELLFDVSILLLVSEEMDGTYQALQMVTVEDNKGRVTVYEPVRVMVPGYSS